MTALPRLILATLLGVLVWQGRAAAAAITWNGIPWQVKSGTEMGPGPNAWSADNVSVDGNGDLHLAIRNVNGAWTCAEISTAATYGFGTYQWQVTTAVDTLDPNVVVGLFLYGPLALGPDGTHEVDIEYARFGSADADSGRYTNWPNEITIPSQIARTSYPLTLGSDPSTTARFRWAATNIAFATLGGLQPANSNANLIHSWTYRPTDPSTTISASPMPVHMNLWLYQGQPPINGQGAEVIIHSFAFSAIPSEIPAVPPGRVLIGALALAGIGLLVLRRSLRGKRSWSPEP